ncbi:MAG: HIT family protein [bacterium]|nr:HIT family protein [bacterium]
MTDCEFCKLVEKGFKLYEDDAVVAVLNNKPAAKGHVLILPKEHITIIEQMPDFLVDKMLIVANKVSTVMFEALSVEGTNIIIENGTGAGQKIPHFAINVIPRNKEDGLSFNWQPKKLNEAQMADIELSLKTQTENIGEFEKENKEPVEMKSETETEQDDLLISQLKRIP